MAGFLCILRLAATKNLPPGLFGKQSDRFPWRFSVGAFSSTAELQGTPEEDAARSVSAVSRPSGRRVKLPKRIVRSPTDILDALASTVGKDATGPHYRYVDDPFFIPTNATNRRIFALSKESGRKAARYMVKKYPALFEKPKADPEISAFLAASQLGSQRPTEPTVKDIVDCMRKGALVAAFEAYTELNEKTPEAITPELRQELLERLCFHNSDDAIDSDLLEEKWFAHYIQKEVRRRWKVGGPADKVFQDIKPKTAEAYAAMICANARFLHVEGANTLLEEMQQENLPIPVQVYNEMIKIVPLLKDSIDSRWEMTMSFLSSMNQAGVAPNLQTFNAVLEVISRIAMWRRSRSTALGVFAEMKRCGIEPSLASYHFLLQIFCRERGPISHILLDVLQALEGKELTLRDPKDSNFFPTAMDVAGRHLRDVAVARKVYDLLWTNNNSLFLTDALKDTVFHGNFLKVLVAGESVENFFKVYDELVPMTLVPDSNLLLEMVKMVEFHEEPQHLPRIWSDAVVFGLALKDNMLEPFLAVLLNNHREDLKEAFAAIALDVKTRIDAQFLDRANRIPWSGPVISSVVRLLLRNGQMEPAWEVVGNYINKKTETFGFPSEEALSELVDVLVAAEQPTRVKQCVTLASDLGFMDLVRSAEDLAKRLRLPEQEIQKWKRIGSGSVAASLGNI
ncbi:Protein PTCD3-like protein, mitochondrial [Hypsibius exemplaris]|uniref:Small ribosomal subunit protein mS39 n=1 Tax=Hypsibius exemplaris TaxID=2072580 RepID=A0A1W0WQN4_HYPEX|nr:Protein PTCD3-like protein, mitochondrial [Hypsibius exemplaris]